MISQSICAWRRSNKSSLHVTASRRAYSLASPMRMIGSTSASRTILGFLSVSLLPGKACALAEVCGWRMSSDTEPHTRGPPRSFRIVRQSDNTNISEAQIRCPVVPLQADRTFFQFAILAGVLADGPGVREVCRLKTVDPDSQLFSLGNDGHRKPLVVAGDDLAGRLAVVNASRAVVDWLRAVIPFPLVADLRLVAAPELPWNATEEDAAIEVFAIGEAIE